MKEMSKMHEEDAHDDKLIAMETSHQIHTRAQMRAAENAAHSHILEPPDVDTDINSPSLANPAVTATNERDNITLLPSILSPRASSGDDSAAARPSFQHDEVGIDLQANLVDYTELEIAKALARHSVEMGLPKHHAPNHLVSEGKMRVVGIKAKKISSTEAVLIVKFISPTVFGKHCECITQKCTHLERLPPLTSHLLWLSHCVLTRHGGKKINKFRIRPEIELRSHRPQPDVFTFYATRTVVPNGSYRANPRITIYSN